MKRKIIWWRLIAVAVAEIAFCGLLLWLLVHLP